MFEKETISMIVRCNGFNTTCYFGVYRTEDRKGYQNFLFVQNVVGKGQSVEVCRVPFDDIIDIDYKKPFFGNTCHIYVYTKSKNNIVSDIRVEKDFFDKPLVNKLIKIVEKYKNA